MKFEGFGDKDEIIKNTKNPEEERQEQLDSILERLEREGVEEEGERQKQLDAILEEHRRERERKEERTKKELKLFLDGIGRKNFIDKNKEN